MAYRAWIQCYSGGQFYPLTPRVEDVRIEDIAHHLSQLNRYTGATVRPYSVAEHCVRVARRVRQLAPEHALWGLLHDASEAYTNDMASPLKYQDELAGFRAVEDRVQRCICDAFGLPHEMPAAVHQADRELLWTEAHALLRNGPRSDWGAGPPLPGVTGLGQSPIAAELAFIIEFEALYRRRR